MTRKQLKTEALMLSAIGDRRGLREVMVDLVLVLPISEYINFEKLTWQVRDTKLQPAFTS